MKEAGLLTHQTLRRPAASAVGLLTLRVVKEAGLLTDQTLRRPAASAVGLLTLRVVKEAGMLTDQTLRRPAASAVGLLTLRVVKEAGMLTDQTLRRPAASAVGLLTHEAGCEFWHAIMVDLNDPACVLPNFPVGWRAKEMDALGQLIDVVFRLHNKIRPLQLHELVVGIANQD